MILTNPSHVSAVANNVAGVNNAIDALRRGSRSDALDLASEVDAAERLAQKQALESTTAHGFSRHGAQTTLEQQYLRATRGVRPDVPSDIPRLRGPDSTRSTSQVLHELAVDAAIANGRTDVIVSFDDGRVFGEGFRSGGTDYFQSSHLRVRFDVNTGEWFSNFWVDPADPNLPQLVLP